MNRHTLRSPPRAADLGCREGAAVEEAAASAVRSLEAAVSAVAREPGLDERLDAMLKACLDQVGVEHAFLVWEGGPGHGLRTAATDPAPGDTASGLRDQVRDGSLSPLRDHLTVTMALGLHPPATLHVLGPPDGSRMSMATRQLVTSLGTVTALSVSNERHLVGATTHQRWLEALAVISRRLLTAFAGEVEIWQLIVDHVADLTGATTVTLDVDVAAAEDGPDQLRVSVAAGIRSRDLPGTVYPRQGSLAGEVMTAGRARLVDPADPSPPRSPGHAGWSMAAPLSSPLGVRGAVVISRSDDRPFSASDVLLVETFAAGATLALELAETRAYSFELQTVAERERIAAGLHDHVVQRLFATGLLLHGTARLIKQPLVRRRVLDSIDALDETIREIRNTIYQLNTLPVSTSSLGEVVSTLVSELQPALDLPVTLEIGDLGQVPTTSDLVDDVTAVLRESLTNVAKHARARRVEVTLTATDGQLRLSVTDDGVGIGTSSRRSGRANLERRARLRGGTMQITRPDGGGVALSWAVPLHPPHRVEGGADAELPARSSSAVTTQP